MKTVLAFGAGMLVGALLALAGVLSVVPDHPGRLAADRVLSDAATALRAAPARIGQPDQTAGTATALRHRLLGSGDFMGSPCARRVAHERSGCR